MVERCQGSYIVHTIGSQMAAAMKSFYFILVESLTDFVTIQHIIRAVELLSKTFLLFVLTELQDIRRT
jgi:hypothetical protein